MKNTGFIQITASGDMSTSKKGDDVVIIAEHTDNSNDDVFARAHAAIDKLKSDLRAKLGDAGY